MQRVICALIIALIIPTAQAQHIESSLSDRQIIANILKECRELYLRSVGPCACAADRLRVGTRCNKVVKDLPESFKPFCSSKDVTLEEISMYRMQNLGFIDRRCSK
ncbi:MAG TPA: hypothetical protein VNL39_13350 [Xanthobacteraceae bacterium]|nr:hypothetical protein [Xanthobacteraceae bacterium]